MKYFTNAASQKGSTKELIKTYSFAMHTPEGAQCTIGSGGTIQTAFYLGVFFSKHFFLGSFAPKKKVVQGIETFYVEGVTHIFARPLKRLK